jgi:hypothetical protein
MSPLGDISVLRYRSRNKTRRAYRASPGVFIGKLWVVGYASPIPIPAAHPIAGRCALRTLSSFRAFAAAAVAVACMLPTTANAARVAILSNAWSAETAADFNAKIPGHVFTGINVTSNVPSLDALAANYDAILLFEDRVFVNATVVGNRVAAFAATGRTVVLGTFYDQDRSDATAGSTAPHGWGALETLDPDTTDGTGTPYALRTLAPASIVAHPLTRGVGALAALRGNPGPYAGGNQAKPGTIVVAAWSQPNGRGVVDPAIAYRQTGAACVIHIGIAPQYGVLPTFGTYGTDFGGDFYRVWGNAFDFGAAQCKVVNIVPGDFGQIGKGWSSRSQLDAWRAGFSFAVVLDGSVLQGGFGPPLSLHTHADGSITAG